MSSFTQRMYVRRASAGTGKTYTLAAHYIALLLHGEHYRSILAVTFTNKATAEMKDRIIEYLYAIAHSTSAPSTVGFLNRVREISSELGFDTSILTDTHCQQTALRLHADLLIHYDEMRVQTIDTFLQSLLGGMIQKLNGAVGYQVELDIQRVISNAVDDLLTQGAQDPTIRQQLTLYMDERMRDEKNWDIRKGLNEIGAELFKESLQQKRKQIVTDPEQLKILLERKQHWRQYAQAQLDRLQQLLHHAQRFTEADFKDAKRLCLNRLSSWQQCLDGTISEKEQDKYFAPFTESSLNKLSDPERFASVYCGPPDQAEHIRQELLQLSECAARCRQAYLYPILTTRYINDLVLMGTLLSRIEQQLSFTNTRLLATTANTLAEALQPGDADFILEKAGIRYKHVMLDEFQDTSSLQWTNFEKLLTEILASTSGSTLIVGDIKQSIYRWRNGDWRIMRDLPTNWPQHFNPSTPQLVRNFRSFSQVVQFNLETMQAITRQEPDAIAAIYDEGYHDVSDLSRYYTPNHTGGFVQVRCYPQSTKADIRKQVRHHILMDMFRTIEQLLTKGASSSDIMILFRRNDEANEILDTLNQCTQQDASRFPLLARTPFVSSSCFQLQFSPHVNLLISALRYVFIDDEPSLYYVHLFAPQFDIEQRRPLLRSMALTDTVELLIQECILLPGLDIPDLSYINCFRDNLRQYVLSNGSDGKTFLRYWDDTLCSHTIPAVDVQGIRLMTIHTAKGLEAANVFLPFCDWDMEKDRASDKLWCPIPELTTSLSQPAIMPISQQAEMVEAGFETAYRYEHQMQRIDNLNLLYVAITRAAQRLFIYADVGKNKHANVGQLMAERCGLMSKLTSMLDAQQTGGENDYVTATYGDPAWQAPARSLEEDTNPLSFLSTPTLPAHCYSTSSRIVFRQSQDSRKYGWNIAKLPTDDLIVMEQTTLGTICHDLLSSLTLYPSAEQALLAAHKAVDRAYNLGIIPTTELMDNIRTLITTTVSSLSQWFTGNWHIQCEEAILLLDEHHELEERRMDRVMWSEDRTHAIVLDYKFGQDNPKYDRQVRHYMDICRHMGATHVEGYLWIASDQQLIPIA